MTDDLTTELDRLRPLVGVKHSSLVWQLADRGPAIVPQLQRIRREGPGRVRATALEILVNIVGEAGLHPADLAAAERLVRIKAGSEHFLNVSLCWDAWISVRGGDQQAIMDSLGLTPVRPATFDLATTVVSDHLDDPGGLVFVTPEMNGWTVVAGAWCSPDVTTGGPERGEQVRLRVEKLSREHGEAHAFAITEYGDDSTWLIAEHGRTVRRYSDPSPGLSLGTPLPIERRLLDALGVSLNPEDMHDNEELDEFLAEFVGRCTARTVAAELSIDIVGGLNRDESVITGTGMLARIPGSTATSIPPGRYRI
ncbi:hypothetical protein M1L60_00365 [Actinoplanes sp. TRM 88003]|uniref:Uncharacterized protein n=1 Tax=Paractinoplanes aksuensis TaxID=2939490 RepID=A0ABT1DGX3_9ACTN|nr:hypothetical protein [Actinoplanes aksuensis]MCO8269036.1 hypothetical protein [Actinoplanes aksuensis]